MTEKKKPAPKHVIRTKTLAYRFGSMKAADTQQKKRGTTRLTAKLPTSLDEVPGEDVLDVARAIAKLHARMDHDT